MLTRDPPVIQRIKGTRILDAFPLYGEPLLVMHMCGAGTRLLLNSAETGKILRPLTATPVRLWAEVLDPSLLDDLPGFIRRQMEGKRP